LVMTMLNLLPVGQLDGGHLTYAWFGPQAKRIGEWVAVGALVFSLFFSISWLVWFFLITRVVGVEHPPVREPHEPLTLGRRVVVVATWVMTALTLMPVPMSMA
jgi:membrane-associated protease RseP (regulator of RpoE activity)